MCMKRISLALVALLICVSLVNITELSTLHESGTSGRESGFSVSDPGIVHLNRQLTTEVSMVWHNQLVEDLTVNVNCNSSLDKVLISGLPSNAIEMPSGNLGQLVFELTPEVDAPLGQQTLHLQWYRDGEPQPFFSNVLNFSVDLQSNLDWGSTSSTFNVNPDTPFSFAVNITNNGSSADEPLIRLTGDVGWYMEWDLPAEPSVGSNLQLQPGQIGWVNVSVWVPPVINGTPIAGQGLTWKLEAISSLDSKLSTYSFSIVPKVFHNASIDSASDGIEVEPGGTGKMQISVRNSGNSQSRVELELLPLDENGELIQGLDASDILSYEGWTARIASEYNASLLGVNESATIDFSFQAPYESEGSVGIRVIAYSPSAPQRQVSVDLFANISVYRSAEIDFSGFDCRSLDPGDFCRGSITVTNNGNFDETFTLQPVTPSWVDLSISTNELILAKGESQEIPNIDISIEQDVQAFTEGEVLWKLKLKSDGSIIDTLRTNLSVALRSNWVFEEVVDEVDASGNMTLSCTVKNMGNGVDGLIVVLTVSHYTEHGLIPPNDAEFDWQADPLRDFQILDLQPGQNMTFRSWAHLPVEEPLNGTLWMNVSTWSFSDPDGDQRSASANRTWIGTPWQENGADKEEEAWLDLSSVIEIVDELWTKHSYTFFAIIFATIAIHLTMKRRRRMMAEDKERKELFAASVKKKETFSEITEKFEESGEKVVELPDSPSIDAQDFVAAFNLTSGPRKQGAAEPVKPELVDAASTVLDHHDEKSVLEQMDEMATELFEKGGAKPHSSNVALPEVAIQPERTIRKDPRKMMEKNFDLDDILGEEEPEDDLDL